MQLRVVDHPSCLFSEKEVCERSILHHSSPMNSNAIIKELTISLMKSHFGLECSQIVEILQFKGRLSFKELERELFSTANGNCSNGRGGAINIKNDAASTSRHSKGAVSSVQRDFREKLKRNLFVLMQQSIVTFYSAAGKAGGKVGSGVFYQVSVQTILSRLRFGRYIQATKTYTDEDVRQLSLLLKVMLISMVI